jgi:uncharacterized membrane protein YqaE (UPF0057 family)
MVYQAGDSPKKRGKTESGSGAHGCVALLLPPLAVYAATGFSFHFGMSLLLTMAGYLPGLAHAIWIMRR